MTIFVITFGAMLLVVIAMSVGVALTGRRLKGSCGGLASGSCACKEAGITPGEGSCARRQSTLPIV